MNPVLIAGLAFVTVTSVILGLWWVYASESALRARLARPGETTAASPETLLRPPVAGSTGLEQLFSLPWLGNLKRLAEQAGWEGRAAGH